MLWAISKQGVSIIIVCRILQKIIKKKKCVEGIKKTTLDKETFLTRDPWSQEKNQSHFFSKPKWKRLKLRESYN